MILPYPEHIIRRQQNQNLSIRSIFGKNKTAYFAKWFEEMKSIWRSQSIDSISPDSSKLQDFLWLYKNFVSKKNNPREMDIVAKMKESASKWKKYFLWYILDNHGQMIWWWVFSTQFVNKKNMLFLGYRAYKDEITFSKLSLWYYIEYLYFQFGFENQVDVFSRWRDRNCYWLLWSSTMLPIHKMQLYFAPSVKKWENILQIETDTIQKETLIFSQNDENNSNIIANIFTFLDKSQAEEKYWLISKRWINVRFNFLQK